MKRNILTILLSVVCILTVSAQSVYDFKVKNDEGNDVSLADYKGKLLLIVNTATRCGFYAWLKNGENIKWNFTKFLVSRDGKVLRRYEPRDKVSDIEADIQQELKR